MTAGLEPAALNTGPVADGGIVAWLRAEIEADKHAANVKIIREHWRIDWTDWAAGTGIVNEQGNPVAVAIGDYAAQHIVRHDPLDVLADCEAKLRLLDDVHVILRKGRNSDYREGWPEGYDEFSIVGPGDSGCTACHYYGMGGVHGYGVCLTVRVLASAYRHREGYQPGWAPGAGPLPW